MKVLFVTALYPSAQEPQAGLFVREHALAAATFAEVVVVHQRFAAARRGWSLQPVTTPELTAGISTYTLEWGPSPLPKTHRLLQLRAAWLAAAELARRHGRFNVVQANTFRSGVTAATMARIWKAPMVMAEHLSDLPRQLLSARDQLEAAAAYRLAHTVMPVSHALAAALPGRERLRVRVVANAVDPALFYPAATPPSAPPYNLVTVGGLRWVKGLDVLWSALAELRRERSDWHLQVVGDGPERAHHEQALRRLELHRHVTLLGWQPKSKVASLLRKAHVFVLPSLWENLPCSLIEALACGVPAVASGVGGIPEVLTENDGVLVPARDPRALQRALAAMLRERDRYAPQELHQRAVARFGRARIAQELRRVYTSAQRRL